MEGNCENPNEILLEFEVFKITRKIMFASSSDRFSFKSSTENSIKLSPVNNKIRLKNSRFKDVQFIKTKLIGVKFHEVDPFLLRMNFTECQLDYSSFYQLKMHNFQFVGYRIQEIDFSQADAQLSYFDNYYLLGSVFEEMNLKKVNFKTSRNFSINLETNLLKGAVFSKDNIVNLLDKYKIKVE